MDDINNLRKLAGLLESDSLGSEIKKAEVENHTEKAKAPNFKGLLTADNKSGGFSFLKSISRKVVDEDADSDHERNYEEAHAYFDEAIGIDALKNPEGKDSICKELVGFIKDNYGDAVDQIQSVSDWVECFHSGWETYEDNQLEEFGVEWQHENGGEYFHYTGMKLSKYYEERFASAFASWAIDHAELLTQEGFPAFPQIIPAKFGQAVVGSEPVTESVDEIIEEDIEKISNSLYSDIMKLEEGITFEEPAFRVGYIMEHLAIPMTYKNISLVEAVVKNKKL